MVKNSTDVGRPVQEELEEHLRQQEQTGLDAEVHWEQLVVVIEKQ